MTLREFLLARGVRMDAAAIMAGVDTATISRIANGKVRASPATILRLSRAFGMSARRAKALCDAAWAGAHPDEAVA
jgi:plasmid maintenance system antidote protein VapI